MKNGQADLDGFGDGIMKIDKTITREILENLNIQAKMVARAKESIESIGKGEVHSLSEFRQMNKKWLKENTLK